MATINPFFERLSKNYLFSQIEEKIHAFSLQFPHAELIHLGVGDVALPLAPHLANAIAMATEEMTKPEGIRGYGPAEGYAFLREAICTHEYESFAFSPEEIFISDGTNSDAVNIQELFSQESIVAIPDPSYPAYLDSNLLAGKKILRLPCFEEEGFLPTPPKTKADLIYLCSPSNPTGVALKEHHMHQWVQWAKEAKAILLLDNVYNCFATSADIPSSIYAIEGAKEVAIEMRSFSKMAGFTSLRCAYMIIPKTLHLPLHSLWMRRLVCKSNGISYPIQKGALAFYTPEGQNQTRQQIALYQTSAQILREGLLSLGYSLVGGIDAPYIWVKIPPSQTSWEFFQILLHRCHLLAMPGCGFGSQGEGFMRFSCFIQPAIAQEAICRLQALSTEKPSLITGSI